jgi:uncharacterized protein (TIGR04255 family)
VDVRLPTSISPCPIIEAIMDIWFKTEEPPEAVIGLVYHRLIRDFPTMTKLPSAFIPEIARDANPSLAHQADYKFERKGLAVLVGPKNVAVGMLGEYPNWPKLSQEFREALQAIEDTGLRIHPERFGLRYINFFSGDIFPKLKLEFALANETLVGQGTFFKIVIPGDRCDLLLQVGKDMQFPNRPLDPGSVIDIEAFVSNPAMTNGFSKAVAQFLEIAHDAEKKLFFSLVRKEFLETLNPKYPPE